VFRREELPASDVDLDMVILFGGGDGGGIVITEAGIERLPPFDHRLRSRLKAVSALVKADARLAPEGREELRGLADRVARSIVPAVVERAGDAATGENSIVYIEPDGGFVCGTTGKPPLPVPWPPGRGPAQRRE
jgi:hypothetical protein